MKKFLASLSLVLLPAFALAQTPAWTDLRGELKDALEAKGDPARGKAAFVPCEGCHRGDATGRPSGAYPRLAGQHVRVLVKQITDIRAGRRSCFADYFPALVNFPDLIHGSIQHIYIAIAIHAHINIIGDRTYPFGGA